MIKRTIYTAIFFLLVAGTSQYTNAQSAVSIKASVDKNTILIGEHFVLRLEANIPENEAIRFFDFDTIPHFEFLDRQKIDTTNTSTGTILTQVIRMTSFDSGHWVIPGFVLDEKLVTDSIPFDVGFSTPFDPNKPYHDIKDVIDVEIEEEKQWWWYIAGGALLLLALILWLVLRKKPEKAKAVEKPINAYEEAMTELAKLEKNKPVAKEYYTGLVDIFRLYIARKKGISSLQKTTDDLVAQLKNIGMKKESFEALARALQLSDFVKFAKYMPTAEDDRMSIEIIKQSIKELEQVN